MSLNVTEAQAVQHLLQRLLEHASVCTDDAHLLGDLRDDERLLEHAGLLARSAHKRLGAGPHPDDVVRDLANALGMAAQP